MRASVLPRHDGGVKYLRQLDALKIEMRDKLERARFAARQGLLILRFGVGLALKVATHSYFKRVVPEPEVATGAALDHFGALVGLEREPGEADATYRQRIQTSIAGSA